MALSYGVPLEKIQEAVKAFQAVEHRIEFVTEKSGVVYYNDSKGTNPDAAIKGIQAMSRPTLLIGGGYDKGSDYTEWIQSFDGKVKYLVLLGVTKEKIAETARKCGFDNIIIQKASKKPSKFVQKMQKAAMPYFFHRHVRAGICFQATKSAEEDSKN